MLTYLIKSDNKIHYNIDRDLGKECFDITMQE